MLRIDNGLYALFCLGRNIVMATIFLMKHEICLMYMYQWIDDLKAFIGINQYRFIKDAFVGIP